MKQDSVLRVLSNGRRLRVAVISEGAEMNQRFDTPRDGRWNYPGRGRGSEGRSGSEGNRWGDEQQYGRSQGWGEGRYEETRPDERYGADDEYPDRSRRFDGGEYGWRGDQGGRGGREEQSSGRRSQFDQRRQTGDQRGFSDRYDERPSDYSQDTFSTDTWTAGDSGPYDGSRSNRGPRSMWMGQSAQQSMGQNGPHVGRGPKGYTRSDERIKEELCEQLTRHPHVDASEIEIEVKNGEVRLSGTIEQKDGKRIAEDVAENISGVRDVRNEIRVQRAGTNDENAGMRAGQTSNKQGSAHERGTATRT